MPRKMFSQDREEVSYWPALTDFVLAILLLAIVLWTADAGVRAVREMTYPPLKVGEIAVSKADWDSLGSDKQATLNELEVLKAQLGRRVELNPDEQVIKTAFLGKLKADLAKRVELNPGEQVDKTADIKWMIYELQRRPVLGTGMETVATRDLDDLRRRLKEAEDELRRRPDKPLVFPLEEASGFTFAPGKADLSIEFAANLREVIVPKIRAILGEFNIEVMEVIGHTDGQPISHRSNLDEKLNGFVLTPATEGIIKELRFNSNADLGLARALAVAAFLQTEFARSGDAKLIGLACRAYSGAQIISPETNTILGATNVDAPLRRRIELRFTRNPKRTP